MAVDGYLGYTKMAITRNRFADRLDFLVLGRGFRLSLDFFHRAFIHALLSRVTLTSARLLVDSVQHRSQGSLSQKNGEFSQYRIMGKRHHKPQKLDIT